MSTEDQHKMLNTLQDFSSVAKGVKLTNVFLTSFSQVHQLMEQIGNGGNHA